MARTSFTGTGDLGFSNVLYVVSDSFAHVENNTTTKMGEQWFIPGNNKDGDNPDSGSMYDRVTNCKALVGVGTTSTISNAQIGKAVQPKTLADWPTS